jgi:enoyl-[acyl-carrier-protein] reductase (NADH)
MVRGLSAALQMDVRAGQPAWTGKVAEMRDITDAGLFLGSDIARVSTGHVLHVDCGEASR